MVRENWRNRVKSEQRWVNGTDDGERKILQGDFSSSGQVSPGRADVSSLSATQKGLLQYIQQTQLPHLHAFHDFQAEKFEADLSDWHPGAIPPAWYEANIAMRVELRFPFCCQSDQETTGISNWLQRQTNLGVLVLIGGEYVMKCVPELVQNILR